ncbi:MAG: hypothetical protein ACRD2I_07895 [Vicinamibacterales bacterium]
MTRAFRWLDRACLPLMGSLSALIALLNYYALHDFHTIDKHLVFRERILHGFSTADVVPSYPIPPTFPMWGYGWVLLLTTNKPLLIALQVAVALASVWYLLRAIDAGGVLEPRSRAILRILMIGCLPWYAYNSIDWSQSLATSCLVVSVALLLQAAHAGASAWRRLAASAICFGLNLNFASDLYLLPLFLAVAYVWYAGPSRAAALQALGWLAVLALTLVPWMIYSWHAVGMPLIKSTNQGHVMLIGLSQDPHHRFGTTYSDGDPLMYQTLREQLGDAFASRFYASCSYEADVVLKRLFIQIVANQPLAYLDLAGIKMREMLTGSIGTYTGEFDEGKNVDAFGVGARTRERVRRYTRRIGHLLQLGSTLFAPIALWAALWRRQRAWALLIAPIAYQYVSCSLAALQPQYVSNVILFQLAICANGVGSLIGFAGRRRAPG